MKWGTRYPSHYVNSLWSMIKRNTERPTRLVCFTDNASGIDKEVITCPLPDINIPDKVAWTPWRKLSLWRSDLGQPSVEDLSGDVLFLDLDVVITGNLDVFFDFHPGEYCVIHNWTQKNRQVGNTTLFRFPVGKYSRIFDNFDENPEKILGEFRIEQQYISSEIPEQRFWPDDWCVSFKHSLVPRWPANFFIAPRLPETARVVAFTGKPDPDEAAIGQWPVTPSWKRIYKHVRPTKWIEENWR